MFVESNSEDAHCVIITKSAFMNVDAFMNVNAFMNVDAFMNVNAFMNVDAFMNMSQLNAAEIWDMRFNEYLRY